MRIGPQLVDSVTVVALVALAGGGLRRRWPGGRGLTSVRHADVDVGASPPALLARSRWRELRPDAPHPAAPRATAAISMATTTRTRVSIGAHLHGSPSRPSGRKDQTKWCLPRGSERQRSRSPAASSS